VDANAQQVACRFPQLTASVVPLYDIRFDYQQTLSQSDSAGDLSRTHGRFQIIRIWPSRFATRSSD
jgi:hypothetical protein